MTEQESTPTLRELHDLYLSDSERYYHTFGKLSVLGLSEKMATSMLELWDDERSASIDTAVADNLFYEAQTRAKDLVDCNPIYLILRSIDTELGKLELKLPRLPFRIMRFTGDKPDIPTLEDLRSILHHLQLMIDIEFPDHLNTLQDLYSSLHHAGLALQKLGGGETDTKTLGDYVDEDEVRASPEQLF